MNLVRCSITVYSTALLCSCTAIENDLSKGLAYGRDSETVTRKFDQLDQSDNTNVNSYLWRASLSAVQALPLATSDPQRGLIITDWYSAPGEIDGRKRISIEILGSDIRRDLVRVSVARQVRLDQGFWVDAPSPAGISQKMEDTILFNARDIRGW